MTKSTPLLAGLAVLLCGCGHRGDPLPPLRRTPPAPTAFRLAQRGDHLELRAVAPAASLDGVSYDAVSIEFLHGGERVDLEKRGRRLAVRTPGGSAAVATLALPAPGTMVRAVARALAGTASGPRTLTMALVAHAPLEPPAQLEASLGENGVRLSWRGPRPAPIAAPVLPGAAPVPFAAPSRPAGAAPTASPPAAGVPPAAASASPASPAPTPAVASPEPAVTPEPKARRSGFYVYRRLASERYREPLAEEPLDRHTLTDEAAPVGATVCYEVRAVGSPQPLIESAPSNEVCLERRDLTPPAPPAGLAALPRTGAIELLFSPSAEADLAGYRVYRAAGEAPPQRIAELLPEKAAHLDQAVEAGVVYRYTLTAFDAAGNESAPGEPVEAVLP